jgi:hypothetical protein
MNSCGDAYSIFVGVDLSGGLTAHKPSLLISVAKVGLHASRDDSVESARDVAPHASLICLMTDAGGGLAKVTDRGDCTAIISTAEMEIHL